MSAERWSEMAPEELLDEAQQQVADYDAYLTGPGRQTIPTVTHPYLVKAGLLLQAAQIRAIRRTP